MFPTVQNYGVFVFCCVLLFVSLVFKNTLKIGVSANLGTDVFFKFGVQKVGSITGPQ